MRKREMVPGAKKTAPRERGWGVEERRTTAYAGRSTDRRLARPVRLLCDTVDGYDFACGKGLARNQLANYGALSPDDGRDRAATATACGRCGWRPLVGTP